MGSMGAADTVAKQRPRRCSIKASAATGTGSAVRRASSARRCSSAFARLASFTGPKPRIVSGNCAIATATSSVSGRSAASASAQVADILLDQRPLHPPLLLAAEQIERRPAQMLAMPQHTEQRQREPSRQRDLAPPSRCGIDAR